jgi:hypothetical protein
MVGPETEREGTMDNNTPSTSEPTQAELAEKLTEAGKKAESQKAARRERAVKGSHLLETLTLRAKEAGLTVEDKSGFLRVSGTTKGRSVYIAKKGGRVDLSGFEVQAVAVTQISEEEARAKHLGKVRGQLNFNKTDNEVLAAYADALKALNAPAPKVEKPAPAPKAAKAPKADKTTAAPAAAPATQPTAQA